MSRGNGGTHPAPRLNKRTLPPGVKCRRVHTTLSPRHLALLDSWALRYSIRRAEMLRRLIDDRAEREVVR